MFSDKQVSIEERRQVAKSNKQKGSIAAELKARITERLRDEEHPEDSITYEEFAEAVSEGVTAAITNVAAELQRRQHHTVYHLLGFAKPKILLTSDEMLAIGISLWEAWEMKQHDDLLREIRRWFLEVCREKRRKRGAGPNAVLSKESNEDGQAVIAKH